MVEPLQYDIKVLIAKFSRSDYLESHSLNIVVNKSPAFVLFRSETELQQRSYRREEMPGFSL